MRYALLGILAVLTLVAFHLVALLPKPAEAPRPPRTCLRSVQGFIPAHQGFWTTETGDVISYAIPDQPMVHCVKWSDEQ